MHSCWALKGSTCANPSSRLADRGRHDASGFEAFSELEAHLYAQEQALTHNGNRVSLTTTTLLYAPLYYTHIHYIMHTHSLLEHETVDGSCAVTCLATSASSDASSFFNAHKHTQVHSSTHTNTQKFSAHKYTQVHSSTYTIIRKFILQRTQTHTSSFCSAHKHTSSFCSAHKHAQVHFSAHTNTHSLLGHDCGRQLLRVPCHYHTLGAPSKGHQHSRLSGLHMHI